MFRFQLETANGKSYTFGATREDDLHVWMGAVDEAICQLAEKEISRLGKKLESFQNFL